MSKSVGSEVSYEVGSTCRWIKRGRVRVRHLVLMVRVRVGVGVPYVNNKYSPHKDRSSRM